MLASPFVPTTRALALLLLVVPGVAVALARGGVPAGARAAAALACGLSLALAARDARGTGRSPGPLFLAPLLVLGWAALQCLPLPAALLSRAAPAAWFVRTLPPLPAPASGPATLDLWATLDALALPALLACAAASAGLLARDARARRALLLCAPAAALLQLGLALSSLAARGRLEASFVNRNHLAALLVAGALVLLGEALGGARRRWLPGALAALLAAGALATLSRGATLGLLGGGAALALLVGRGAGGARPAAVGAALALAAGAAFSLSAERPLARWLELAPERTDGAARLQTALAAARLAGDHWLLGLGRGAFRFASEQHRTAPGDAAFLFAEDEPLQLAAEVGLPAALAVLALLWLALRRTLASAGDGAGRGALAAVLALALHNLADFNLELAGVALPLTLAWAAAGGATPAPRRPAALWSPRLPFPAALLLALAAGSAGALALAGQGRSAEAAGERLVALAADPRVPAGSLLAEAGRAAALHPADWLVSLAPALGLHARSPPRTGAALAWAGRAQWLAPGAWRPHAVTAAILLRAGARGQARLELKAAFARVAAHPAGDLLDLVLAAASGAQELLEATPDDARARLALAVKLEDRRRPAEAEALLRAELARLGPGEPLRPAFSLRLAALRLGAGDLREAEALAGQARRDHPCIASVLLSRAAAGAGAALPATEAPLRAAVAACPRDRGLALELGRLRQRAGDAAGALAVLEERALAPEGTPWEAEGRVLRAEALEALGERARALRERAAAAVVAADQPGYALDAAARLLAQGDRPAALALLRQVLDRAEGPAREALRARLTELERR